MFMFIALALIGAAAAQRGGDFNLREHVIDDIHGVQVWYDDEHNIFLFSDQQHCYIVEANSERWDAVVTDLPTLHKFVDAVYAQILAQTGLTTMTRDEAETAYHSRIEEWGCRDKTVAKLSFTAPGVLPAGTTAPPPVTTAPPPTTRDPLDFLLPGK